MKQFLDISLCCYKSTEEGAVFAMIKADVMPTWNVCKGLIVHISAIAALPVSSAPA